AVTLSEDGEKEVPLVLAHQLQGEPSLALRAGDQRQPVPLALAGRLLHRDLVAHRVAAEAPAELRGERGRVGGERGGRVGWPPAGDLHAAGQARAEGHRYVDGDHALAAALQLVPERLR